MVEIDFRSKYLILLDRFWKLNLKRPQVSNDFQGYSKSNDPLKHGVARGSVEVGFYSMFRWD